MVTISKKDIQDAIVKAIDGSVIKKEGKKDKVRKFTESLDLIVNIKEVNLKDPKMRISLEVILPNPIREKVSAMVVCDGDRKLDAEKLGFPTLDKDGLEKIPQMEKKQVKKIVKNHEYFIAQADLMRFVAQYLGRYLGPRGRMPIPPPNGYDIFQPTSSVKDVLERYKSIVRITMKKQLVIQLKIGKKDMEVGKLTDNAMAIFHVLEGKLPRGLDNVKTVFVKTTMGPSVKVVTGSKKR
ncbi:MAG: 50S ribosomal protein L1 [Promethearchaeota archaeon]